MNRARAADVVAPIAPGETLAEKYRVERILGKGGMGVVVAAWHLQLEERVAIKFLYDEAAEDPVVVTRFVREARAAAKIRSEHVARVFDVGTLDGGTPYIVMEYLDGSDLGAVLAASSHGRLPIDVAIEYVLQACEALAEAHVRDIVHRDLKPANLFVTRRADGSPCVKVLDFGISKSMAATSGANGVVTSTSAIMGSPHYMSPEQLSAPRDVDARADIWSLGVLLFELVSGKPPFSADTLPQLCTMILHSTAPALRTVLSTAPPSLEALVARCLETDRAKRFATIGELALALAPIGPERARLSAERASRVSMPDASNEAVPPLAAGVGEKHGTVTDWGNTKSGERRGRATRIVVIGAVVALAVAVALQMRSEPDRTGASSQPSRQGMTAAPAQTLAETAIEVRPSPPATHAPPEDRAAAMIRADTPQQAPIVPRAAPSTRAAANSAAVSASARPSDIAPTGSAPSAAPIQKPAARPPLPDDRL